MCVYAISMGNLEKSTCLLLEYHNIDCYRIDGNLKMKGLSIITKETNQNIEFDISAIMENIRIVFETTIQAKLNKEKIDEFLYKYHSFISAQHDNSTPQNLNIFSSIPNNIRSKLTKIKKRKLVYIGASKELETDKITSEKLPNSKNPTVINSKDLEYLKYLEKGIRAHTRNNIFVHLKINPLDPDTPKNSHVIPAIKLESKKISDIINTDTFLSTVSSLDLLDFAHVPTRHSYDDDNTTSQKSDTNYQPLLKKEKSKIKESMENLMWIHNLIQNKKMIRTTIGIMLGANAILGEHKIKIPKELQRHKK